MTHDLVYAILSIKCSIAQGTSGIKCQSARRRDVSKYSERVGMRKYIHIMMVKKIKNKIFKNRLVSEVQFSHRYILEGRAGWYGMCATTIILGRVLHDCGMAYLPAYTVKLLVCGNLGMFLIIAAYILAIYLLAVVVNCVESNTNKIVNNYRG